MLGAALAEMERAQAQERAATLNASGLPSLLSSQIHKCGGAHIFSGHEDTLVPGKHSRSSASQGSGASQKKLKELEGRLAAAERLALPGEQEAELENGECADGHRCGVRGPLSPYRDGGGTHRCARCQCV